MKTIIAITSIIDKGWVEVVRGNATNKIILPAGKIPENLNPEFIGEIQGCLGVYQITLEV